VGRSAPVLVRKRQRPEQDTHLVTSLVPFLSCCEAYRQVSTSALLGKPGRKLSSPHGALRSGLPAREATDVPSVACTCLEGRDLK
jgi:hypothetical protein